MDLSLSHIKIIGHLYRCKFLVISCISMTFSFTSYNLLRIIWLAKGSLTASPLLRQIVSSLSSINYITLFAKTIRMVPILTVRLLTSFLHP